MLSAFATRSDKPELIDTGDYTPEDYEQFLIDIRLVNRFAGDNWALNKSLMREIVRDDLSEFSVLDVGAGSGELLRTCSRFANKTGRGAKLFGLELNGRSAQAILEESKDFNEIESIRADALNLPFKTDSFDYVICSLFTHHFLENEILKILSNMSRVARRKIFVIDLHRHRTASVMYKVFCMLFIKGVLVKTDGALSILKGFKPKELVDIAAKASLHSPKVTRRFPFRLVLEAKPSDK